MARAFNIPNDVETDLMNMAVKHGIKPQKGTPWKVMTMRMLLNKSKKAEEEIIKGNVEGFRRW